MRRYSSIESPFWTGPTGRAITAAGKDVRILATHQITCEQANMIGIYRIPVIYVVAETGLKEREVVAALETLQVIGFSVWDPETEFVWVRQMARVQLGLLRGEALKPGDHRAKGVASLYRKLPENPWLGPFFDHYKDVLHLPFRRGADPEKNGLPRGLEGDSEGLGRGLEGDSKGGDGTSEPLVRGPYPVPVLSRKGEAGETMTVQPAATTSKRTVLVGLPENHSISEQIWAWAAAKGFPREFVEIEFEKFCDRNRSKAERYADWNAAFRNWLLKAREFAAERNGHAPHSHNGRRLRREVIPL